MKTFIRRACGWTFGWLHARDGVMALATFLSFIWFTIDWCLTTTFRPMSDWMLYAVHLAATMLALFPWMLSRRIGVQAAVLALLGCLFEANLMYCRTYFTAIPPASYLLVENMADFTASIADSCRMADLGFPVIWLLTMVWASRARPSVTWRRTGRWLTLTAFSLLTVTAGLAARGGFYNAYNRLIQDCYYFTCGVPTYTLAGHLAFHFLDEQRKTTLDESAKAELRTWFDEHVRLSGVSDSLTSSGIFTPPLRKSLVFIICESLDSWPIGAEINGKPITPYLNSLIEDSTTLYAPKVLTQVCAGHSIDGQLIYTTGLLPTSSCVYSMKYPGNTYPSLNKILKADRGAKSLLLSTDKLTTWNQGAVADAFGYDRVLAYGSWTLDELIAGKLSDGSFFRQSVDWLAKSDVWPEGTPAMLTFITISGHHPYVLTDALADPAFDASVLSLPQSIRDYINVTHYVDSQLHTVIDYLRGRADSQDILIVILGDHEGLGMERSHARSASPEAAALVGEGKYVPMIVLNAPRGGRYDKVMGQVDVFPTLLDMLGLRDSAWRGLGMSILNERKVPAAYTLVPLELFGDTAGVSRSALEHLRLAPEMSECIILHDLLKEQGGRRE